MEKIKQFLLCLVLTGVISGTYIYLRKSKYQLTSQVYVRRVPLFHLSWAKLAWFTQLQDMHAVTLQSSYKLPISMVKSTTVPLITVAIPFISYWYIGPLKEYWAYLRATVGRWPHTVSAKLRYTDPCDGCSRCVPAPPPVQWRWWHFFIPPKVKGIHFILDSN